MRNIFKEAERYAPDAPTCGDEDIARALLVAELADKEVRLPLGLKRDLEAELTPWLLGLLDPAGDDANDLPWDGFDDVYYRWLEQEPALPRPTVATT